ncbi:hypothetical protein DICPUDRAFT_93297 [Dictyostelium purpureum]|uniref:Uncharacterized protein n=1 Tax=Dictyostelium purpureum TaxID=5786 RepID=F1A5A7_DICPU|nr:uncharacterized protein DICPUDRAFT_93297 [Dictyostelium purpureum]EGC28621.1 hypothetical protein DICPUDRAFT_93297 [Dictyostelium purpureum]|eukprot:XP_003294851.1 hypothetical protein DICPUDRAFT_93297 [Dictyostelium purpureum]
MNFILNECSSTVYPLLFPSTLVLLDLQLELNMFKQYNYYYEDAIIKKEVLPPSLIYLVIRGEYKPTFIYPLPKSLQYIFISSNNQILNDKAFRSENLSPIFKIFDIDNDKLIYKYTSKLFKTLKNKI